MNTLPLIVQLAGITALATFIWLVIRAFGKHAGWGIAVLLLSPVGAIVFGINYWKSDKLPFLAYITTSVTAIALCLYLFTSWGGWDLVHAMRQVQQGIATQTLTERDTQSFITLSQSFAENSGLDTQSSQLLLQAKNELARQAENQAAVEAAEAEAARKKHLQFGSMTKKVKPAEKRYRLAYMTINVADAANYVGSTVKITRKNVLEREYRLVKVSGNRLELAQQAGTGSYTFRFRNSDVEKIRVLTKQPY